MRVGLLRAARYASPVVAGAATGLCYHVGTAAPLTPGLATFTALGLMGGLAISEAVVRLARHSRDRATAPYPAAAVEALAAGKRYTVIQDLGEGGHGIAQLAFDPTMRRLVVLKKLHAEFTEDDEMIARFEREAQTMARFNHPGIPQVYEVGRDEDGLPFIAMEHVSGPDLYKFIQIFRLLETLASRQRVPLRLAAHIMIKILEVLSAVHQKVIVHRDLKPENIIVIITSSGDLEVKIIDFGLAKALARKTTVTRAGVTMGTYEYMSPEQIRGQKVGPAADLYAAGVIFYEMLTGLPPFTVAAGENLMGFCERVLDERSIPDISRVLPATPPLAVDLLKRMMAKDPLKRPVHADILRDLQAILDTERGATRPFPRGG